MRKVLFTILMTGVTLANLCDGSVSLAGWIRGM